MLTIAELRSRIGSMIREDLLQTPESFDEESNLFDHGLDSMAVMQFLLLLEEEFNMAIPVESVSLENFKSINSVTGLMAQKLGIAEGLSPVAAQALASVEAVQQSTAVFQFDPDEYVLDEGQFGTKSLMGTDLFVCAFEDYNQKRGLRGHWAYSLIELKGVPNLEHLQNLVQWLPRRYRIVNAALSPQRWFRPPHWQTTSHVNLPLHLWYPRGLEIDSQIQSQEYEGTDGDEALSLRQVVLQIINERVDRREGPPEHINFDLVLHRDGNSTFVMSWNHLIFDGLGAESFIQEVQRYFEGRRAPVIPSFDPSSAPSKSMKDRYFGAKPMIDRFRYIIGKRYSSVGSTELNTQQKVDYEVVTLSVAQSKRLRQRVVEHCGELVQMPFYLAAVMRAHHAVQMYRGQSDHEMLTSIPVQARKKGAVGPLFQNCLTMFYARLNAKQCATLENAVQVLLEQHTEYTKEKLGEAFSEMMELTRFMPPNLNLNLILWQMKGVLSSFYHSNTGIFANGLKEFLGCPIENAYHVPGIGGPPGTGVFFSECQDRITVVTCWILGSFKGEEKEVFTRALWADLGWSEVPNSKQNA